MSNQIVLSFAGETQDLSAAFGTVGKDAGRMADETAAASDRMAEKFDNTSTQASMLSGGIGDIGGSLTAAFGEDSAIGAFGAEMERYGTIVMGVVGMSDLLLFATNNLKLAQARAAIATKAQAAATWVMNTAMLASPLTWVVIGIGLVVAAIVLIATKTDWFSRGWKASWGWIKSSAQNVWEWLRKVPGWIGDAFAKVSGTVSRPFRKAFDTAKSDARNLWDWLKKIPGWVGDAFAKVSRGITSPFKAAFNAVARGWNSTIGSLSWSVPTWVPGIGGNSISVPKIPTFHSGGIVPGMAGQAVPIMALGGERVGFDRSSGAKVLLGTDGSRLGDLLVELIRDAVRGQGGDPAALGLRG